MAYNGHAIDFDIVNCHAVLLLRLLDQEASNLGKFTLLRNFCKYPRQWRSFLSEYLEAPINDAKRELVKLLYMGQPRVSLPCLLALQREVAQAAEVVLAMPRFAYLGAHFSDRRNPMASRLSYALSAEEDGSTD